MFSITEKNRSILNTYKLSKKLLVLYLFAFLIPLTIILILLSTWLQTTLEKWQYSQAESSVTQTAVLFKDMLENAEELSDSLYVNEIVQKTLTQQYKSTQEVYEQYIETAFLDDFLRTNKSISSFRYYTENPTILDNAYFIKATPDILQSDWYNNAKQTYGRLNWVMKTDNISMRHMLSLVRPVRINKTNQLSGILSVNLDPERIQRLLQTQENDTYIVLNGRIEFCSHKMPENRLMFSNLEIPSNKTELSSTSLKNEKTILLANSIFGSENQEIILVQVIKKNKLLSTTIQGIFILIAVMLGGTLISFIFIRAFSRYFNRRVNYINSEIKKVVQNNFELGPRLEGTDEFTEIYDALCTTSSNIKKLIDEVYQHNIQQEQLLSRQNDIRFKMLASQINPHFLFNTLETIRMQSLADGNKDVAQTIKLLAKILRHNLSVTDRPVPLIEEIEAVSNYLDIQHLRFADRVTYDIILTCDINSIGILPLLIQPVVENSFKHGLESRTKDGFIYICIDSRENDLYITIRDNGTGIEEDELNQLREKLCTGTVESINYSIGMVNVNQRIKLYYGQQYGLEIESEVNTGTTVTIHVPNVPVTGKGEGENV